MKTESGFWDDRHQSEVYEPRENLRPEPGDEWEQWADLDEVEHARQKVWWRSKIFARNGGAKEELLDGSGALTQVIRSIVNKRIARIQQSAFRRRQELTRTIESSNLRSKAQLSESHECDKRTYELAKHADALNKDIGEVKEAYDRLPPGRRGARLVGKEAIAAATSTGLADGTAFVLTINGLGGALLLRLAIALTLALALNVSVMALARSVAGLWTMLQSKWLRIGGVIGALGVQGGLITGALVGAGDFREHALTNLDKGLPTDPRFLVWVGLAAAFGATMALASWHYAGEGDRLIRRMRALEARRDEVEQAQQRSQQAAMRAKNRAYEIVHEAQAASAALDELPGEVACSIAQEVAERETLAGLAKQGFAEGEQERKNVEESRRQAPVTAGADTAREIDEAINKILAR
jgi:hypothetical protein